MSDAQHKFTKRKARTSYVSTVVGITLVLFLLGAFGSLVLNAQKLSVYAKENIVINIFLKDDTKEVDIIQMKKELDIEPFAKQTTYVSKEEAGELMKKDLGEDFVEFLGYNPLLPSIDLQLNANYAVLDSIEWIRDGIAANDHTRQVVYNPKVVENIDSNVNAIGSVLLIFSVLLLVISIAMVAVVVELADGKVTDMRVAVGSCSPVAERLPAVEAALVGMGVDDLRGFDFGAEGLLAQLCPISDVRGSAEFRLDVVPELCRRAVLQACGMEVQHGRTHS